MSSPELATLNAPSANLAIERLGVELGGVHLSETWRACVQVKGLGLRFRVWDYLGYIRIYRGIRGL